MKMARSKDGDGIKSTLIIAEVQKRPVLYDANHQNYGERTLKMQNWEEVCAAVLPEWATMSASERHASGKEIQKRWRSIRDSYTKAYRQGKCMPAGVLPAGSGKRSQHHRQMSFLYNALQRKIPRPSIDKQTTEVEPSSPQPDVKQDDTSTIHIKPPMISVEEEKEKTYDASIETNRQDLVSEIRKLDNASLEIKIDANTILPEDHFDDDKLFMNSLLPFFKKMNDDTRLACRIEVLKIIKYALQAQKSYKSGMKEVRVKEEASSPRTNDLKTEKTPSSLRLCRKREATPDHLDQPVPVRRRPGRPRKNSEERDKVWWWPYETEEQKSERNERRRKREEARERNLLAQDEEEMYRATSVTQLKPPQFLKMYNLEPAKKSASTAVPASDILVKKELLQTSPL